MRKITFIACLLVAIFASAQFSGPGFYRVRNAYTNRCISIKGTAFEESTYPDAFWTCIQMQEDPIPMTDPGSIIYIPSMGETSLYSQGVSTYSLTHLMLTIDTAKVKENDRPTYLAKTKYDKIRCIFRDYGCGLTAGTIEFTESRWWIEPVNEGSIDTSFLAVKPVSGLVSDADGYYWATILCDFPFVLPLDGGVEGAYTVKEVKMGTDSLYYAAPVRIYGQGDTVPGATPVLLRCKMAGDGENKIIPVGDIANHTEMPITSDMLAGNYFSSFINHASYTDRTVFKEYVAELATPVSSDYLVLGVDDEGRLGFYPMSDEDSYMPANTAWLAIGDLGLDGVTAVYLGEAPEPEPDPEPVLVGDVNDDGALTIQDVTMLINYIMADTSDSEKKAGDGDEPTINKEAADINGDGVVNITDVGRLVAMLLEYVDE